MPVGRDPVGVRERQHLLPPFVHWCEENVFEKLHAEMLHYYHQQRGIDWEWASLDSAIVKAPKGGSSLARTQPIAPSSAASATF